MSVPRPAGPPPKPPSKRRRANKPASYGLAEPIEAGNAAAQPAEIGFPAHELVLSMWAALGHSVESRFYSAADWQRVRMELHFINRVIRGRGRPSGHTWGAVQSALNDLLVSPADKRRIGIELKAAAEDPDEVAAVLQLAKYQDKLAGS
jgi:hypothetical protein